MSEQTVFNYFRTKEDLVYWRLESFEDELLGAVRERAPGESFLAAFGRFVLQQRGLLAERDPEAARQLEGVTRMISESPALLAREEQVFDRYTESLSALIAEQTGAEPGDVQASVAANALIGVHRSLVALHARSDPRRGPPSSARARRPQAGRARARHARARARGPGRGLNRHIRGRRRVIQVWNASGGPS